MGQAREAMDRLTEAVTTNQDAEAVAELFAEDAVALTPEAGELHGRYEIAEYWRRMTTALPDARFESVSAYECGDTAVDEGYYSGRNTGPVRTPDGRTLPATQNAVRIRGVDIATVADGLIVDYRLYFDRLALLEQLGLPPEPSS
ncbi:nuclear transport factor 2 family protein [Streptomyces sp. Tu 3180]|uniref:ester cyclase n=1 Tax=Streptomyces sp. Tu 3180 TaxID=2682611 RepID=UPI0013580BB8|nr:nuclear transport factor 2 family protein [Streptomyces sp. Tu 3180]KAF3466768.1 ester cyclase [Streptomyces sp. Tu 3180]